jgi:hypothetical protein
VTDGERMTRIVGLVGNLRVESSTHGLARALTRELARVIACGHRRDGENPLNLKLIKRFVALSLTVLAPIALTACGSGGDPGAASANGTITIRYNTSQGSVNLLELASELGYLPHIKLDPVGTVIGGPADIQSVATDQTDIGGAFNGSIVKLIAAGAKIKAVIGYYWTTSACGSLTASFS